MELTVSRLLTAVDHLSTQFVHMTDRIYITAEAYERMMRAYEEGRKWRRGLAAIQANSRRNKAAHIVAGIAAKQYKRSK